MEVAILLFVIAMQLAMGVLDAHQDLTEWLAWHHPHDGELPLHGLGLFLGAALFITRGWFDTLRMTASLAWRGSPLAGNPARSGWVRALRDLRVVERRVRRADPASPKVL
jgi:hypothetical protein